ncbi:MAG: tRNA1(Val) (adenine(37)-N6)-methyltransferase [Clostridia bacterium]|nr:tRNA1(Val) (adenine(37)-N6)-methyltransferase [Clostridia bacterium]
MDAVLLADFAQIRPHDRVVDLGTGTCILPLLLSGREPSSRFDAVEIQPDMADMAERSVKLNQLQERIAVHCADMAQAHILLGQCQRSLVVCNPPYGRQGETLLNPSEGKRLARYEESCTIHTVCQSAARLLKNGGRFCVVFPAQRMLELMDALRSVKLEPKRFRLVYPKASKAPNLVLLEAIKDAKPMLHPMPPLIVYNQEGEPTAELRRIYHQA